jgi:hypothetical protein
MCDSFKSDIETVEEAIGDANLILSDLRSDILRAEIDAGAEAANVRVARKKQRQHRYRAQTLRRRLADEKAVMASLREELRGLKPARKPRKPKGFPVTDLGFDKRVVTIPAGFTLPEVQSTNIYD